MPSSCTPSPTPSGATPVSESGLHQMDELRQRARRQVPPVRHPPKRQPSPSDEPPRAVLPAEEADNADEPVVDLRDSAADPLPAPVDAPRQAQADDPVQRPVRRRQRVRATQVHLDELSEEHLSNLKKRAVLADVDLTNSAVLRLALAELVERHGYDRIVAMFEQDQGRLRRGRPRR